jgi:hypothetical protein
MEDAMPHEFYFCQAPEILEALGAARKRRAVIRIRLTH